MTDPARPARIPREPYSLHERIDVCRGLFALLVVVAHSFELAVTLDPTWNRGMPWIVERALSFGPGVGTYYVMGFFILSGYCIQCSIGRSSATGEFPLRRYLTARATRILPLYYLGLAFAVVVEWGLPEGLRPHVWYNNVNAGAVGCQVLMVQNLTMNFGSFSSTWSITNEVAYYLIFGLLAAACVPLGKKPAVVGMVLCVAVGMMLQAIYRLGVRDTAVLKIGLLFGLGAVWHLGALVAVYSSSLAASPRLTRAARLWPAMLLATMLAYGSHRFHQEFIFVSAGITFALMMVRFIDLEQKRTDAAAGGRATRWFPEALGLASYPVYLFHGPILLMFGAAVKYLGASPTWWAAWFLSAATATALCMPMGGLLERPTLAWRAGVLRRLSAAPAKPARPATALGAAQ